eukprot:11500469-Heterocapsa_arctica.AAC.1
MYVQICVPGTGGPPTKRIERSLVLTRRRISGEILENKSEASFAAAVKSASAQSPRPAPRQLGSQTAARARTGRE